MLHKLIKVELRLTASFSRCPNKARLLGLIVISLVLLLKYFILGLQSINFKKKGHAPRSDFRLTQMSHDISFIYLFISCIILVIRIGFLNDRNFFQILSTAP